MKALLHRVPALTLSAALALATPAWSATTPRMTNAFAVTDADVHVGAVETGASESARLSEDPERLLLDIHRALQRGDTTLAAEINQRLLEREPRFRLGQWLAQALSSSPSNETPTSPSTLGQAALENTAAPLPLAPAPSDLPLNTPASQTTAPVGGADAINPILPVSTAAATQTPGTHQPAVDQDLRLEARLRLIAAMERVPDHFVPREFIELPPSTRHAIAVDATRARLYLFERTDDGMRRVADHYVSLGLQGVDKLAEGDQRTPLGVYFLTSRLYERQLDPFYGVGALTLNYPNEYDRRRGRTGSGIWLHGVPEDTYARAPWATDGCVVLANEDMAGVFKRIDAPQRTPVLISPRIDWVEPAQARQHAQDFLEQWRQWQEARASGALSDLMGFYSAQFSAGRIRDPKRLRQRVAHEFRQARDAGWPGGMEFKEVSVLSWTDQARIKVVTFAEVWKGRITGPTKRQYWGLEAGQWRIFFEGELR